MPAQSVIHCFIGSKCNANLPTEVCQPIEVEMSLKCSTSHACLRMFVAGLAYTPAPRKRDCCGSNAGHQDNNLTAIPTDVFNVIVAALDWRSRASLACASKALLGLYVQMLRGVEEALERGPMSDNVCSPTVLEQPRSFF